MRETDLSVKAAKDRCACHHLPSHVAITGDLHVISRHLPRSAVLPRADRLFVEGTMAANEALKRSFPYNLINASGSIQEVRSIVMQELAYQSCKQRHPRTAVVGSHLYTAALPSHRP